MSSTALSTAGRFPVRRKRPNRPSVDNAPRLLASTEGVPVQAGATLIDGNATYDSDDPQIATDGLGNAIAVWSQGTSAIYANRWVAAVATVATQVPTLSEWNMVLLAGLIALLGLGGRWRRKRV